ncbi:anti-repressor SinI family protein [Metabacillus halosaccharovorans]|uniref:anti-repressor SinI family protein n=1 Tax=Metabacillus halosaccharovorans TaxID=930124 RepID=UPI000995C865|nr:anti-repressor SinI family protein [Metabacillus halosaccharovorans]
MGIIGEITHDGQLDQEWVELILEALELGISVEEIKEFLSKKSDAVLKSSL